MNTFSPSDIPVKNYGVLFQEKFESELDEIADQIKRLGYAIIDSGYLSEDLAFISDAFNLSRCNYIKIYGEENLKRANEFHTVRAPLTHGHPFFINLATNFRVLTIIRKLIAGKFILNQQNGVINPPGEIYNQLSWHRDLPYQHFVSSSPLAINALFCLDDFTHENGSTFVLPSTHKSIKYPSEYFVRSNALQLEAKAGQYILLDCMLFHSGGFNRTATERRAVNHVYTIPYFKQQIKLPELLKDTNLTPDQKELFGFNFQEPRTISQYIATRFK